MTQGDGSITSERIMKGRTMVWYYLSLIFTIAIAVMEAYYRSFEDLVLIIPIAVALGVVIFTDRKVIHIPQILILMMMISFIISLAGKALVDGNVINMVASILNGVNLALVGLISVYTLLKSMPGVRDENPRMVSYMMLSVAIALFVTMKLLQYTISIVADVEEVSLDEMMRDLVFVIIGAILVCLFYRLDRGHGLFRYTLGEYLVRNSDKIGLEGAERLEIVRLIEEGESDTLEFKSTIRTNLQTGEIDKRMEKAVLKTLVAFMNTDGGTLLVGVADDGSIIGVDLDSFENRDKMNLHITNLIASSIGNEFLPYILFNQVEFDDKVVVRFKCEPCPKPVFLKEGKNEIFYVRSGPSSVEVTGMNLINYVNNRYKLKRKRKLFGSGS